MTASVVIGGFFVLLGAAFVALVVVRTRRLARLKATGIWVTGVVTHDYLGGDDDGIIFVKWVDGTGNEHVSYSGEVNSFLPRRGEQARVLYDPNDPSDAIIEGAYPWLYAVIAASACFVFGTLLVLGVF